MEDFKQDEAQETMSVASRLKVLSNSTIVPNELLKFNGISSQARILWIEFLSYCFNNSQIFPGMDRVSKNLGWSKTTTLKHRKELEDFGFITVTRRGLNKTNLYELDVPVINKNADRNTEDNTSGYQDNNTSGYQDNNTCGH